MARCTQLTLYQPITEIPYDIIQLLNRGTSMARCKQLTPYQPITDV